MAKVAITEFMDPAAVELLTAAHDVTYDPTLGQSPERLLASLDDIDALIVRNRTNVDHAVLQAATHLRIIGRLGVGLDNIDTEACQARGVVVKTAAGANAVAVAEYVIGALLSLARPALHAKSRVLAGEWPRNELIGSELSGKSLGLLGFGATSREVASRAQGLSMVVIAYDPFIVTPPTGVEMVDLDTLFGCAATLSVHLPLTPETTGLVDAARLELLAPGSLLVDTSRGGIVDHLAVTDALRRGHLGGAALDVFPEEPPSDLSIYAGVPNLILTPHVAGITEESNARVSQVVARAVLDLLSEPGRGRHGVEDG